MNIIKKSLRIFFLIVMALIYIIASPVALVVYYGLNDCTFKQALEDIKDWLHSSYFDYVNKYLKDKNDI